MSSEQYNRIYSENDVTFGAGKPEKTVEDVLKYRTSGSVLELGAGEGRNSLFLARKGFDVTAQDISEVGINKIAKRAEEQNLSIRTEISDVRNLKLEQNFDVLISTFMFHHLSREDALELIKQMQAHTNIEGLNAVTAFTKDGEFFRDNPKTSKFYAEKDELKDLYNGWEILEYEEVEGRARAKRPDGSPIFNVSARLLAKKTHA